jgi:hypothetical protein
MALSPKDAKTISDISMILYDFLPGSRSPYADQSLSFPGVARDVGVHDFWIGGSKQPAISALLSRTYELRKGKFCDLVIGIVNKGIVYRMPSKNARNKKEPVQRSEILELNDLIFKLGFKIPELWDKQFLDGLSSSKKDKPVEHMSKAVDYTMLLTDFTAMLNMDAHARGFAFESFLNRLFDEFELNPRKSFRLKGEQIDGSLELDGEYYLIEAKWQKTPLGNAELLVFDGKIVGKTSWTRGIIISHSGFSKEGLEAYRKGRQTNLVAIDGQDLYAMLSKNISFVDILKKKVRYAAETGEIYKSVFELFV